MSKERQDTKTDVERVERGKWAKGASPNPGGQPKWVREMREALKDCAPLAKRHLAAVLGQLPSDATEREKELYESASVKDRNQAADTVLAYTLPKPKQTVDVKHRGKVEGALSGVDVADLVALAKAQPKEEP